ncbi:MAG: hypothetical protein IJV27_08605 [Prevotella sp.]|nr:hypothetical protein [Prevotella sp.]
MIPKDKYTAISPILKTITHKVWEVENRNRKEGNESELELYQEGFSIEECYAYKVDNTIFYFACNYSFLKVVEKNLLVARKNFPYLFGTSDANHILDALYKESGQCCSKEEYCEYLRNYACCYHFHEIDGELNTDILRIDLFRLLKTCKNNPNCLEFVGGFLHSLDHFSINGQNLATGNDINDISDVDDVLIYIAKAFLKCEGKKGKEIKVKVQMNTGKPLNCVFFWDDEKGVYYLTTIHRIEE